MTGSVKKLVVISLVLFAALYGCGNPMDSAEDRVTAAGIGIDKCYTCHELSGTSFDNYQIFVDWSQGPHGNLESVTAFWLPGSPTLFGFPDYTYYMEDGCEECHDKNLDSQYLAALAATFAPGGSTTLRPVVGCEACHGSGAGHLNALFPPEYPSPDFNRCGQCHNSEFDHNEHHPEGDNIVEDYTSSNHNQSVAGLPFYDPAAFPAACGVCHSDDGARQYSGIPVTNFGSISGTLENVNPIQCRTCHDPHNPDELLRSGDGVRSAEVATCTGCHHLVDGSGNLVSPPVGHFDEQVISDTHWATAGSYPGSQRGANQNAITGYAFSFTDERACRNCHNVHSGDITINEQWAGSGHANTAAAAAWAHYNWTESSDQQRSDGTTADDYMMCQRCHTTTAYITFAEAGAPADTSYYGDLLPFDPDFKPEMLKCNGCHSDNAGGLRDPGAYTAVYDVTGGSHSFAYTDLGGSNVCMPCHTARISGTAIAAISGTAVSFSNQSFMDGHYLSAGATLFQAAGYEFGLSYGNYGYYEHDLIGLEDGAADPDGPCIGCHLKSEESHHFSPVEHSTAGTITAIVSETCEECHAGAYALTAAELEEQKEGFHASLDALEDALADNGLFFKSSYPYFFNTSGGFPAPQYWQFNWLTNGDTDTTGNETGKNNMGAAFNYSLLHHEPGAWAHNRLYAKLLIFDSIDWLEAASAVADSSVYTTPVFDGTIDLSGYPEAAEYLWTGSDPLNAGSITRPTFPY